MHSAEFYSACFSFLQVARKLFLVLLKEPFVRT